MLIKSAFYVNNLKIKSWTTLKHLNQINRDRFTKPATYNIQICILQPWSIVEKSFITHVTWFVDLPVLKNSVNKMKLCRRTNSRSCHLELFWRKVILKICVKFTGEHPCRSVISIKLQLHWNHTSTWVFSCKVAAYFQNTFSQEPLADCFWNFFFYVLARVSKSCKSLIISFLYNRSLCKFIRNLSKSIKITPHPPLPPPKKKLLKLGCSR